MDGRTDGGTRTTWGLRPWRRVRAERVSERATMGRERRVIDLLFPVEGLTAVLGFQSVGGSMQALV